MKTLPYEHDSNILIVIDKIEPFINKCVVNHTLEKLNIKVEYTPNDKLLDIVSYREYFETETFNDLLENIVNDVYFKLNALLQPKSLKVILYLVDDKLTPWSATIEKGV